MNLLLFRDSDWRDKETIAVADRRLHHLRDVIGAREGDAIKVGEIGGRMGLGRVVSIGKEGATLQVLLDQPPPPKLPVTLVLALPRPKMLRRILRAIAELGVRELHLVNSYRVEKSYWQTPVLDVDTTRDYLLQGLEQARDTILPDVVLHRRFKPFVEDIFPALLADRRGLLAQPADYPLAPADSGIDTVLVVGPEGGFIPYEVDKLVAAGCSPVSLGSRILRVETAVSSFVGRMLGP